MDLNLSRVHFPVTALGPGKRLGIWFQGCSLHCPGCISADTWGFDEKHRAHCVAVEQCLADLEPWLNEAEGITITGGEPFDQAEALHELLAGLRRRRSPDILVYSGYALESLRARFEKTLALMDVLISDPYEESMPQTFALRGSDNQRMSFFTEAGRTRFRAYERALLPRDKVLDIMFDADGSVWMAGIPRRGDMQRLVERLHCAGYLADPGWSKTSVFSGFDSP